jgi:hypothetical protein
MAESDFRNVEDGPEIDILAAVRDNWLSLDVAQEILMEIQNIRRRYRESKI